MKKTDKTVVVIIKGDNNKVSFGGGKTLPTLAIVILSIAMAVLAISLCCPELLADCVRWMIGTAING